MKTLSIIIPTYNEEFRIENTLINFHNFLVHKHYSYEIIVADDGSTDKTIEVVENLKQMVTNLHILPLKENKGKGQAVREGMLHATGAIRLFSDADGSTPIEELDKILALITSGHSSIAIGSRYHEDSLVLKAQPYYRRAWSRFANRIVQRTVLPGVVDPNCGFKAFTAEATTAIFSKCQINEWSFDLEVLALAQKLNFNITEVPVKWINDEQSKGKIRHVPREIRNLYRIKKQLNHPNQKYDYKYLKC